MPLLKRWVEKPVPQRYACQSTVDSVLNRKLVLKECDLRLRTELGQKVARRNPKRIPKVVQEKTK